MQVPDVTPDDQIKKKSLTVRQKRRASLIIQPPYRFHLYMTVRIWNRGVHSANFTSSLRYDLLSPMVFNPPSFLPALPFRFILTVFFLITASVSALSLHHALPAGFDVVEYL